MPICLMLSVRLSHSRGRVYRDRGILACKFENPSVLLAENICQHLHSPPNNDILQQHRYFGEGNGYPLQYSCLENSMDRGAWQDTVHGMQKVGNDWATNTHRYLPPWQTCKLCSLLRESSFCLIIWQGAFCKVTHTPIYWKVMTGLSQSCGLSSHC